MKYIVAYALNNFERPVDENTSHMEYGRSRWGKRDFFTFNNYGWFQFNCVNESLREIRTLESVLSDMGVKSVSIQPQQTFIYHTVGEETVADIIYDTVSVLREWGAEIPSIYHTFNNDPNKHMVQEKRNIFGILNLWYGSEIIK